MRIEVKGRNTPVNDELREYVEKRFRKVANQVSELARLEVELREENNPAIAGQHGRRGDPLLKGVTLRAKRQRPRPAPRDQPLRGGARPARSSATARSAAGAARARPPRASGRPGTRDLDGGTQAAF